jgi:hypothetical protein
MRAIRLFIDEEELVAGKGSTAQRRPVSDSSLTKERQQESAAAEEAKPKAPVTYQVPEPPSALVREEDFAKQLRLARYLAGAGLGPPRVLEKVGDRARSVTKPKPKAKAPRRTQKVAEAELARERRRVQQSGRQKASSGPGRSDKQRSVPGR